MGMMRVRTLVVATMATLLAVGVVAARPIAAADGPTLSVGDQSGLERDSVTGSVFMPIYLSEPATEPVVVSYWTQDGTAIGGVDYLRWGTPANPRTVTIPTGAAQTQVNVPVLTDNDTEADETFTVTVTATGGDVVVGTGTGTGTIIDADAVPGSNPAITVSNPTVIEGDQDNRLAQYQVHLSRPPAMNVTISYTTADGTAAAGVDYKAKLPGRVVFAPGQISKTIDVLINSNTSIEGDRTLTLNVAVIGGSPVEELQMSADTLIVDDDSNSGSSPTISDFTINGDVQPSPALVAFGWTVSDPEGDELTCRLDGDGDATFDVTITDCAGTASRNISVPTPGSRTALLEVDDGTNPPVTATVPLTVPTGTSETFDVVLRGTESLGAAEAAAFAAAEASWESTIIRGIPDVSTEPRPGCLAPTSPDLPSVLDDVIIDVSVGPIDGVGEILASAGPRCVSLSSELTAYGIMQFDSADVAILIADGTLTDVIKHEMGHVLGIGTLWDTTEFGVRRLLDGAGGPDPRFTGARAIAELSALGSDGSVPVENTGGPGTQDAHWSETIFGNELMTGFINPGANPTSAMTIASLADLGYRVDLGAADSYTLPGASALRSGTPGSPIGTIIRPPIGPV